MAKKILEVHQLTTKYITRQGEDVYSVDHVSLDIEEGKSLGIAGESGCGKSTLALSLTRGEAGADYAAKDWDINGKKATLGVKKQ